MKRIITASFICVLFYSASAQEIRLGAKFAYNSTWLFNTNVSDKGESIDNASAFGSSFGITSIIYFSDEAGVSIDLLFAKHNGKFESGNGEEEWTEKMSFTDVPVLFHLGASDGGGYVEIGPQFSFLSGVKEDASSTSGISYTGKDFKNDFNSMNIAAILGFGYDFFVTDNLFIAAGIRLGYGLGDATKEFSESDLNSADRSEISENAHIDATGSFNYVATHRAFGGLNIGITYSFGTASRRRN